MFLRIEKIVNKYQPENLYDEEIFVALAIIGIIIINIFIVAIIIVIIIKILLILQLHIQLEESLWTRVKRWLLLVSATSLDLLSRQCQLLDPSPGEYDLLWLVWFGIV